MCGVFVDQSLTLPARVGGPQFSACGLILRVPVALRKLSTVLRGFCYCLGFGISHDCKQPVLLGMALRCTFTPYTFNHTFGSVSIIRRSDSPTAYRLGSLPVNVFNKTVTIAV